MLTGKLDQTYQVPVVCVCVNLFWHPLRICFYEMFEVLVAPQSGIWKNQSLNFHWQADSTGAWRLQPWQFGNPTFACVQMSNEKGTPCCSLGYVGDEILPSYAGIFVDHYKDPN